MTTTLRVGQTVWAARTISNHTPISSSPSPVIDQGSEGDVSRVATNRVLVRFLDGRGISWVDKDDLTAERPRGRTVIEHREPIKVGDMVTFTDRATDVFGEHAELYLAGGFLPRYFSTKATYQVRGIVGHVATIWDLETSAKGDINSMHLEKVDVAPMPDTSSELSAGDLVRFNTDGVAQYGKIAMLSTVTRSAQGFLTSETYEVARVTRGVVTVRDRTYGVEGNVSHTFLEKVTEEPKVDTYKAGDRVILVSLTTPSSLWVALDSPDGGMVEYAADTVFTITENRKHDVVACYMDDPRVTINKSRIKLEDEGEDDDRIAVDDPRIAWIWEKAESIANEREFCAEYDDIAKELGIPGRTRFVELEIDLPGTDQNTRIDVAFEGTGVEDAAKNLRAALAKGAFDVYEADTDRLIRP